GRTVDVTEMDPSLDRAAGEMISSTRDLAVFLDALLSAELVSADALAEMRGTEPMGMGFHYGLGLQRFDAPCGGRLWGHGGQLLGYRTYAYRSDDGRTLTMVAASDRSPDYATVLASVTAVFCAAWPARPRVHLRRPGTPAACPLRRIQAAGFRAAAVSRCGPSRGRRAFSSRSQ